MPDHVDEESLDAGPELKVFISSQESTCDDCKEKLGRHAWILLAGNRGALCLACADLDHLVFLPSGDSALTRRARRFSSLSAVVLKWSRARKRYERRGLLVEEAALERAEAECLADAEARARRREREAARRAELDQDFVGRFAARVRELFPCCPVGRDQEIAEHACLKYSGRVGRTAAAKDLDEEPVWLAVRAHLRHRETQYDALLARGLERHEARTGVQAEVERILEEWRGGPAVAAGSPGPSGGNRRRLPGSEGGAVVSTGESLRVRVNDELVLDAGTCEETLGPQGPEWLIRPPETTLFHQVLAYLKAKPDPPRESSGSMVGREGVAAAAVCLRWGSYLAVLADRDKQPSPEAGSAEVSLISDEEMARINIEASAALAEWIDIYRTDPDGHARLVKWAVTYLPMSARTSKPSTGALWELSNPEHAGRLATAAEQVWSAEQVARARAEVNQHPTRVLANAAVNVAWRNGPVENIHAGQAQAHQLAERRVTPDEERRLMRFASDGLALAMKVIRRFGMEAPRRSWPEQVLPYALGKMMLITPSGWTLTEASRDVQLPR